MLRVFVYCNLVEKSDQYSLQKMSFSVFYGKEKVIQVWNNVTGIKLWQSFHYWVNYAFNSGCYFRQENKYWSVLTQQTLKIVLLH